MPPFENKSPERKYSSLDFRVRRVQTNGSFAVSMIQKSTSLRYISREFVFSFVLITWKIELIPFNTLHIYTTNFEYLHAIVDLW